jgi:hypothetical protein
MLVNITQEQIDASPNFYAKDLDFLEEDVLFVDTFEYLDVGMYEVDMNFSFMFSGKKSEYPFHSDTQKLYNKMISFSEDPRDDEGHKKARLALEEHWASTADYGVADSYEQVLKRYPRLITDPRKFIVTFTRVTKEHSGDWRWEKWGPYIGDKNPRNDYLKDEDDSIMEIFVFNVIEVK